MALWKNIHLDLSDYLREPPQEADVRMFRMPIRRKDGHYVPSKDWYLEWRDAHGYVRRMAALADKRASTEIGRRIEQLVNCQIAGIEPSPDLLRWVADRPPWLRVKLERFDLIPKSKCTTRGQLRELLNQWLASLEARGRTQGHIAECRLCVTRILEGIGAERLSDLDAGAVERWLAARRNNPKAHCGARTANKHLRRIKTWLAWCVTNGRADTNPVAHLAGVSEGADRRLVRRALTVAEVRRLLQTTATQPARWGISGPDRALLYRFAVETGLRAGAIRSLTADDFDLKARPPTVTVSAVSSKSRREQVVVLRRGIAPTLRQHCANVAIGPVFAMPARSNLARMLREDLAAARIPVRDRRGRVVDFHALRMTLSTALMQAGVHPDVQRAILGHTSAVVTLDRYTDTTVQDQARGLARLPDFGN
jgi:integrase